MADKEGKGFTVTDRRTVLAGEAGEASPAESPEAAKSEAAKSEAAESEAAKSEAAKSEAPKWPKSDDGQAQSQTQARAPHGDGEGRHTGRTQGMAEEAVADGQRAARSAAGMPEIDFGTFVMSLASSVLVHLGELVPPGQAAARANLPLAKQTIDILGMLQEKTRGNLGSDEAQLLEHLLYDLRLKYVDVRKRGA